MIKDFSPNYANEGDYEDHPIMRELDLLPYSEWYKVMEFQMRKFSPKDRQKFITIQQGHILSEVSGWGRLKKRLGIRT